MNISADTKVPNKGKFKDCHYNFALH